MTRLSAICFAVLLLTMDVSGLIPALPQGAEMKWVVVGPEEIVSYLLFDPATVREYNLGTDCKKVKTFY